MKCPCKDCFDRTLTCHSGCKQYAEWKEWRESINQKRQQEQKSRDTISERGIKMILSYQRRNRK